jgi:hypothetical protein
MVSVTAIAGILGLIVLCAGFSGLRLRLLGLRLDGGLGAGFLFTFRESFESDPIDSTK